MPVQPVRPAIIRSTDPKPAPEIDDNPKPTTPVPAAPKTIREAKPAKNSGKNSESIPNNSESIRKPAQNAPKQAAQIPAFKKRADVGRRRKYDETGIFGDIPIKDVVLFRHIKQRHWPGMSADMKEWYEWFYFTKPVVGEQTFRGKNYEQHKRAYERGQRWIAAYSAGSETTAQTVGDSGSPIIPFPKRANG